MHIFLEIYILSSTRSFLLESLHLFHVCFVFLILPEPGNKWFLYTGNIVCKSGQTYSKSIDPGTFAVWYSEYDNIALKF